MTRARPTTGRPSRRGPVEPDALSGVAPELPDAGTGDTVRSADEHLTGDVNAARVFINYRDNDCPGFATLLYLELSRRFGSDNIFLDSQSIPAGMDFERHLLAQLRGCHTMLAVIGPRWLTPTDPAGQRPLDDPHDWIRRELAIGLAGGAAVIPVLTDKADMPTAADLPADITALARCQYRRLRHRDIRADLDQISADLVRADPALAVLTEPRRPTRADPTATGPAPLQPVAPAAARPPSNPPAGKGRR
jgi:hypothetical protein